MKTHTLAKASLISLLLMGILLGTVYAQIEARGPENFLNSPVSEYSQIELLITNSIRWLYTLLFIFAVAMILVAAYNFVRGGSNEEYIKKARNQLKWAIVAIALALVASGISVIVQRFLISRGRF